MEKYLESLFIGLAGNGPETAEFWQVHDKLFEVAEEGIGSDWNKHHTLFDLVNDIIHIKSLEAFKLGIKHGMKTREVAI